MNLASWIILAIVIAVAALAIRSVFFKKDAHGSCCDAGDAHAETACGAGCAHCPESKSRACDMAPRIKPLE